MDPKFSEYQILYQAGADLKERKIYLIGDIDVDIVETAVQTIDYLNSPKHCPDSYKEPITLLINSMGGVDDQMFFLYDSMQQSLADIITIGYGLVCSAASLILAGGTKRMCSENCYLMVHKGSTQISGNEDEIQAGAAVHKQSSKAYWRLMEKHSKIPAKKWMAMARRKGELWIDSSKMLELGVVDSVLKPKER